jgi:hypothetical protein
MLMEALADPIGSSPMATTTKRVPDDIVQAIENEEGLTEDQLRRLITFQAEKLGLTYEEAVERGRKRTLPKNLVGSDIEFLVMLLPK